MTTDQPQTWHYGLIARYWAEFDDEFRPHEMGTSSGSSRTTGSRRSTLPAEREGCSCRTSEPGSTSTGATCRPTWWLSAARRRSAKVLRPALRPPIHGLDLQRRDRTIYVCGAFGLGSTREQDAEALRRFRTHLEPGGMLLLDVEVPWADAGLWKYWLRKERGSLPGPMPVPKQRHLASDGGEYALASRVLDVDPLDQRSSLEMRAHLWRDGELQSEEIHRLDARYYFVHELALLLERAGFELVVVHGDHVEEPPTPDDEFVVFVATT